MNKYLLLAIILIEGFVSIATEIITMRQLMPVVGNSVIVTSFIIGTVLLALAYGYKRGGQYQENYIAILQRNFILAGGLLGIGLSYSFIMLFFNYFERTITTNNMYILAVYLLAITMPLMYLLGQTVPITMNLFKSEERASAIGSKVLHLSTFGSFIGAVLTTVLFMNYFGVAWTVLLNSICIISIAALLIKNYSQQIKILASILLLIPTVYWVNIHAAKNVLLVSNAYSNYNVLDQFTIDDGRTGKVLAINHSASSFAENDSLQGFKYVEKIKDLIFKDLALTNKNILVLGGGGFSVSAAGEQDNHFTYVDIDPDLAKVVNKNYLPQINGKVVVADARVFLRTNKSKFAVIISDVYGSKVSIPGHLVTKEYFALINDRLDNDGTVIFNMLINPRLHDSYSQKVDNTIRAVFSNCMAIPTQYGAKITNVLYVCGKESERTAEIYTDNKNAAAMDIGAAF